ncbi:MAG TPA: hypothetical protein VIJ17_13010 [Pseudolabrys sp.]
MLEILHHDAVVAAPVPAFRIVGARIEMIPERLRRRHAAGVRHGVVQHDVAVLIPEREIVGGQHRLARRHVSEPAFDLGRIVGAGHRRVDARGARRRNAAGGGHDPALERLECRRILAEIMHGLFEPAPGGVDDEMIELALLLAGRDRAALPRRHGARPHALELTDAERADLARRRQRGDRNTQGRVRHRHGRAPILPAGSRK